MALAKEWRAARPRWSGSQRQHLRCGNAFRETWRNTARSSAVTAPIPPLLQLCSVMRELLDVPEPIAETEMKVRDLVFSQPLAVRGRRAKGNKIAQNLLQRAHDRSGKTERREEESPSPWWGGVRGGGNPGECSRGESKRRCHAVPPPGLPHKGGGEVTTSAHADDPARAYHHQPCGFTR